MISNETGKMNTPAKLTVTRQGNESLLLQLSGSWTLQADLPETSELENQMSAVGAVKQVAFNTAEVDDWDSGLLTWLLDISDFCMRQNIEIDSSGLPEGVDRLLALAYAVPEREGAKRSEEEYSLVADVGSDFLDAMQITGEFIAFFGDSILTFWKMLRGKAVYRRSDLWVIIQNAGVRALPIVSLVSFLVGLILAYVGAIQLQNFGAGIFVADLVGIAMTREMAAIMTGIIMAGRTGAAYAAELGTMTVNEEIDALETSGFPVMEFLVLPRMVALMLMMPLLVVYADLMGILGGAVVAISILDLTFMEYYVQLIKAVSLADFFAGIFMGIVFGGIVAVIGCLNGIKCGRSSQAVGLATTSAVVSAMVMIVIACAVMTIIFNVLGI
jgi:phospholipid/cholesterol/gamma-HCH transport system permease protein